MQPIEDLAQFRALAETLPPVEFNASGIVHPRLSLFAATKQPCDVDIVTRLVSAVQTDGAFLQAVEKADADLRVYELDLANPSTALGASTAALTIAYGMTAIEPGPDLFALGVLHDAPDEGQSGDSLEILATACSRDVCALFGALLATRMAAMSVIIDGWAALKAALLLHALNESAVTHCAVPKDSAIETAAQSLGLKIVRCNDPRPLYALADSIVHTKNLMPV